MLSVEALREFGADVDSALIRCMNNEAFYLRLVRMAMDDPSVAALGNALEEGNLEKAFDEAHKLKGIMGNLSLTPVFEPVSELTELLRNRTPGDYKTLYSTVLTKTEELKKLMI
ncbi:MAG: Hpt domain-containing protein [Spirochaetales bacterium]|nr:Hpt domain-containing protein [Spirochaetales bacterium]